nr:hypothetical protein [Zoogloeaceae bacterium]
MLHDLVFSVPEKFATGLLDGSIVRYGTLLKDAGTGRILAHVQETGLAQQLLSNIGIHSFTPWGAVTSVANLATSGYASAQIHQLRGMLETMQVLQFANVGMAAVGLGVSAVGFAVINRRLNGLKNDIEQFSTRVEHHFQELKDTHWRQRFSSIQVCVGRADRAFQLSEPKAEWLRIEAKLDEESGYLAHSIQDHLGRSHFDVDWFKQLTTSLILCDAVRLRCLVQADELKLARSTASAVGKNYTEMFDSISAIQLADKITRSCKDQDQDELSLFRRHRQHAQLITDDLQEVTDAAISKSLLIEHLIENKVSGSRYLSDIAEHHQHPIVLLTT